MRRFWTTTVLMVIIAGALILRFYAVEWGLPYVDHPDEPTTAKTVLEMLRRGDWNPRFFDKPSLYYYALRVIFEAHWRYGLATGLYSDISQLPLGTYFYITTPGFFIWGRMLTALFGVATVILVNAIGRRWWGAAVGLSAASVLAVLPFHVRHSQFLTVDVLTGLMTALALAAALRLLEDQRWRAYALAGLLAGLAASTKYNAIAVALAVVLAHGLRLGRVSLYLFWRLPWMALWSAIGFFIATPYALMTPDVFLNDVLRQYADYTVSGGDLYRRWPVAGYLNFFWSDGLLPLPCIAMLIGIVVIVRRRDRAGLVMLGFALPYLLFVMAQRKHFFRNLMPIFPVLVLLAGIGIVATISYMLDRVVQQRQAESPSHVRLTPGTLFATGTLLLSAIVAIHPLIETIALDQLFAQPHSKVQARDYVRQHLPRGAPIAMALNPADWHDEPMVTLTENIDKHDADWYRAQGYRYLVGNVRDDSLRYKQLRAQACVLAEFADELDGRASPHMEVLDLGFRPDQLAIERRESVFGDKLRFLGFQHGEGNLRAMFSPLPGAPSVQTGHALQLNLYWQSQTKIEKDYAIFLHLLDTHGRIMAQRDTMIRAYDYPTSRWQPGELVIDLADLYLPPQMPDGVYRLEMGVYDMRTMERLPIIDAPSDTRTLMEVRVRHAL